MKTLAEHNVPGAFSEALHLIKIIGVEENTRNGPVLSVPEPFCLEIYDPMQRVLFHPKRDANPFFHMFEFIWMMAGSNEVRWLSKFNSNIASYSDNGHEFNGAYGYRWRYHFGGVDQITTAAGMLKRNKEDRRVVIGMWDPRRDLGSQSKDIPCNTQINFRIVNDKLDMTVFNRSNDLVWGMLGANAVHMTMLQELIARSVGVGIGTYRAISTNLHIYTNMPRIEDIWQCSVVDDRYKNLTLVPLLQEGETLHQFLYDSQCFVNGKVKNVSTNWFKNVALPALSMWRTRDTSTEICADDWSIACREWVERRQKNETSHNL